MTEQHYTIPPLEWEERNEGWFFAYQHHGLYMVSTNHNGHWACWFSGKCICTSPTAEAAKATADEHHRQLLEPGLRRVE